MKTKTIDISEFWDSADGVPEVVIKRIGFGEQNDILDASTTTKVKSKTEIEIKPEYGKIKTLTLSKCIVSAPFPVTLQYIQSEMDGALGDFLFEEIDKNNALRNDKKKSSEVVGVV